MWKPLKCVSIVILGFVGFAVSGIAPVAAQGNEQRDEKPEELAPSPLEVFAARSTATVVWSKQIWVLKSQESRATVTALIVEDPTSTPSIMRGLRIDLVHTLPDPNCDMIYVAWRIMCQRANAAVYVEEGRLEDVRKGLEGRTAELRPGEGISEYESWVGSVQVSRGLIVCGYQFSDRRGNDLAALFTRAIAELKEASH